MEYGWLNFDVKQNTLHSEDIDIGAHPLHMTPTQTKYLTNHKIILILLTKQICIWINV